MPKGETESQVFHRDKVNVTKNLRQLMVSIPYGSDVGYEGATMRCEKDAAGFALK